MSEHPEPDRAGELFLGPLVGGRETYLLKGSRPVFSGEAGGPEFWHLDREARVLAYWRPRYDCDCEYGLRTEYELRDFTLLELHGKTNDSSADDSWHWRIDAVLDVYRRLDADGPETRAFWQARARLAKGC